MDETSQESKLRLIGEVQSLSQNLGDIPDRYDWIIYTEERWQDYFQSWSAFLKAAGLIKNNLRKSYYDKEKLCEVLRTIEKRAGRRVTPNDWECIVDDHNQLRVLERNFCLRPGVSSPPVYRIYCDYTEGRQYELAYDDRSTWLNFRYGAGLDHYSREELIDLGLERLNTLERTEPLRQTLRRKNFIAATLKDAKINREFTRSLPHFAIYDEFRSIKYYFEVVVEKWLEDGPDAQPISEAASGAGNPPQEVTISLSEPKNEDIDALIYKLNDAFKLIKEGVPVEIIVRANNKS